MFHERHLLIQDKPQFLVRAAGEVALDQTIQIGLLADKPPAKPLFSISNEEFAILLAATEY